MPVRFVIRQKGRAARFARLYLCFQFRSIFIIFYGLQSSLLVMITVAVLSPADAALTVTVKVVELLMGMVYGSVMPPMVNVPASVPDSVMADTTRVFVLLVFCMV